MKRAIGHGFWLSLLLNMLFRAEWLVFVAVLIILHFVLGWSLWLICIPLACWFIHSLLVTVILGWANTSSNDPAPKQENKNPYSKKTSDYQR